MYITITPQNLKNGASQSVGDFVDYLEKENIDVDADSIEYFFNQNEDKIEPDFVKKSIDRNTKKLKKKEPKFYSITINPSKKELEIIGNDKEKLKAYTREIMKDYAASFQNEINGRKITVDDIVYYAKIETSRTYKGKDREVIENTPYRKKLRTAELKLARIELGKEQGNASRVKAEIKKLHADAPHKINGKMIEQGMKKEGAQSHVHIIVSRKDASNNYSLSPGSKYKSSESTLNGKRVKRGFDRDGWFSKSEAKFDKMNNYDRNYVLSYQGKKDRKERPEIFWKNVNNLNGEERKEALKLLGIKQHNESSITQNISKRLADNLKSTIQKVVLPPEVKEAIGKINNLKNGKIPNTNISIAELNSIVKDAQKIVGMATKGMVVPEPTLQAAKLVLKYSVKLGKAIGRNTGVNLGI